MLAQDSTDSPVRCAGLQNELPVEIRTLHHWVGTKLFLQRTECLIGFGCPTDPVWSGFLCQISEWGREMSEVGNELSIVARKAEKCSDLSLCHWRRKVLNPLNLAVFWAHLTIPNHMSQIHHAKLALLRLYSEPCLPQSLQNARRCPTWLDTPRWSKLPIIGTLTLSDGCSDVAARVTVSTYFQAGL